jgi:hypothetical protein
MTTTSKVKELAEVLCVHFKLRYATKQFAAIPGVRAPRDICGWYLAAVGAIGEALVRMWERGEDGELDLTDIEVQDLIDGVEGGLVVVMAEGE